MMILYKIKNLINGKIYVGQTTKTLKERWKRHLRMSHCRYLHRALNKYGSENFKISEIGRVDTIEELNLWEEYYIQYFNTIAPNGYNLRSGGGNSKLHPETRKKLSKPKPWLKGIPRSAETRKKISEANKGHPNYLKNQTEEGKRKISEALKGRSKSAKTKKKMRKMAKKLRGKAVVGYNPVTGEGWFFYPLSRCKEYGFSDSNLAACCKGKRSFHKGFIWNYYKMDD